MQKDSVEISSPRRSRPVRKTATDVEAVISFLLGDVVRMTKDQTDLCNRVIFVDGLIAQRTHSSVEIVERVMEQFGVSQYRANQDIQDCHKIFAETRKIKKEYLLAHHIDNIRIQIKNAEINGDIKLLAKLYDSYTYALNSIPADVEIKDVPPATIVYNFNGQLPVTRQPLEDVITAVQKLLKPAKNGEYIEFEENSAAQPAADDGKSGAGEHDAPAVG